LSNVIDAKHEMNSVEPKMMGKKIPLLAGFIQIG